MKTTAVMVCAVILALACFTGCKALLPSGRDETLTPWKSFADAKSEFERVVPNQTTTRQLKTLGFDLYSTPNITILNYVDISRYLQAINRDDLSPGFQKCLHAQNNCRAYELEPKNIKSKRYGNFWLDLFNFNRKSKESGWRFRALFVVVDDLVVEKLWSGSPMIEEDKETTNPLGPLQDSGSMIIRLIPY